MPYSQKNQSIEGKTIILTHLTKKLDKIFPSAFDTMTLKTQLTGGTLLKSVKTIIPADSPFITNDTRQKRWAIPYNFECLNHRIDNLLGRHKDIIRGKKILDIASHMGTFSYAALQMGARLVHGVDSEKRMVKKCLNLFEQHKVTPDSYRFDAKDVFEFLENIPENTFDTIFCFGLLYYTTEPYHLLKLMRRAAQHIILDTFTAAYAAIQGKDSIAIHPKITDELLSLPLLLVTQTQPDKKDYRLPASYVQKNKELSLTTFPTGSLLELWMQSLGMEFQRLDWSQYATRPCHWRDFHTTTQKRESHWADIYTAGIRVSYRIKKVL